MNTDMLLSMTKRERALWLIALWAMCAMAWSLYTAHTVQGATVKSLIKIPAAIPFPVKVEEMPTTTPATSALMVAEPVRVETGAVMVSDAERNAELQKTIIELLNQIVSLLAQLNARK